MTSTHVSASEKRRQRLSEALEQILHLLLAHDPPERVIVFGSLARETVSEWSDLDLVIIKKTEKPFIQRSREVALLCRPTVGGGFSGLYAGRAGTTYC